MDKTSWTLGKCKFCFGKKDKIFNLYTASISIHQGFGLAFRWTRGSGSGPREKKMGQNSIIKEKWLFRIS